MQTIVHYSGITLVVIPAKAGIHAAMGACGLAWTPAYAGVTGGGVAIDGGCGE